jgi:hypothetical protein
MSCGVWPEGVLSRRSKPRAGTWYELHDDRVSPCVAAGDEDGIASFVPEWALDRAAPPRH